MDYTFLGAEKVFVISSGKNEEGIARQASEVLNAFGVNHKFEIISPYKNPEKIDKLIKDTSARVFITVSSLSASLPGYIAARTTRPVIGVPVSAALNGLDSLLSMAQMPPNVPVATVGIGMGKNAALLALQILALEDNVLAIKLRDFKEKLKQ